MTENNTKTTQTNENLDANGKFAKGNTAGKGKQTPEASHRLALARAFNDGVSTADMLAIAKKLIEEAKKGNVKAAKEVLDRCLGKAQQTVELNLGLNEETMQLLGMIDGSSKGQLPDAAEGEDVRQ